MKARLAVVGGMLVLGCSAGGTGRSLDVGKDGAGGASGGLGTGGTGVIQVGDAGPRTALSAHIEHEQMTVEFITLGCEGTCADVVAVARGAFEPYTYTWEDGSRDPARHVCPTETTNYEVTVTDHGSNTIEFRQDPQTAKAKLTAALVACEDGGAPRKDAGSVTPPTGPCDEPAKSFVGGDTSTNPMGNWSYGWNRSASAALTPYSTYYPFTPAALGAYYGVGYPDAAQWFDKANGYISADSYYSIPPLPEVQFNPTNAPSHPGQSNLAGSSWTLAPGELALAPGREGQFSIARWTAPSAGTFAVTAAFKGLCGDNGSLLTTADVHVLHGGAELGGANLNVSGGGNTYSYSGTVTVAAGDTLDFAVGAAGAILIVPDTVGIDVKVCPVLPAN